jgi:hypothetical protein
MHFLNSLYNSGNMLLHWITIFYIKAVFMKFIWFSKQTTVIFWNTVN